MNPNETDPVKLHAAIRDRDRMIEHQAKRIEQLFNRLCRYEVPPMPEEPVPLPETISPHSTIAVSGE